MEDEPKVKRRSRPKRGSRHPVTQKILDSTVGLIHDEYLGDKGAYASLSHALRRAVDVLVMGGTGVAAAKAAGHEGTDASLWVKAHGIRRRPDVIAAIAEREALAMEEAGLTLYRSFLETRRIAYFDPAELLDDKGNLKPMKDLSPDARAAIQSVEVDTVTKVGKKGKKATVTTTKIKLWSKLDALKVHFTARGVLKQASMEGATVVVNNNTQINSTQEAADRVEGAANATDAALEYQQLMGNVLEHKP
jgi:hypothetical protein